MENGVTVSKLLRGTCATLHYVLPAALTAHLLLSLIT